MEKAIYYPEDILVGKIQNGEYGWLDYVNHFSKDWQEEYKEYCQEHLLCICDESAEDFVNYKSSLLEEAMENGDA